MMKNSDFCVFILTHGRPDHVITYKSLMKGGYTGKVYFVIDNEDKTADQYYKNFGRENVIMFDKKAISDTFDEADNFEDRRAIVYARNACFDIARDLGFTYFLELDDDYTDFRFKFDSKGDYGDKAMNKSNGRLDHVFDAMLEYYKSIPVKSIAFAQGGDFIGGKDGSKSKLKPLRKCMNTFFCSTERPFKFLGRINEDVNTYTWYQSIGNIFLTITNVGINQLQTQSNKGGMTDIYLDSGTYVKSFYSVMYHPTGVKIKLMQSEHKRLHHEVRWKFTAPYIIDEKFKKK
jgi:hypothetical protein